MTNRAEDPDAVFIVGCQRSGTTWLQLLLAEHPGVVTANETHLFNRVLGPMLRSWEDLAGDERDIGLPALFSAEEFLALARGIGARVIDQIRHGENSLVVEKTPDHALWGREILQVFPAARIVHLVRDPRDVCASLLAAGESWGSDWAPASAYDAANRWNEYVGAASRIRSRTAAYRELRYEDLHADAAGELAALLDWIGLPYSDDLPGRAAEATRIDRLQEGGQAAAWDLGSEPDGFFRKGGTGTWEDDLTRSEIRLIEHVCREGMAAYGYRPTTVTGRLRWPPPRLLWRRTREWLRRRL